MARLRSGTPLYNRALPSILGGRQDSATLFRLETGWGQKVSPLYEFLTFSTGTPAFFRPHSKRPIWLFPLPLEMRSISFDALTADPPHRVNESPGTNQDLLGIASPKLAGASERS